ncbi:MAG: proton-conducting transporter membrane subunit [Endomicrobiia bacterium]
MNYLLLTILLPLTLGVLNLFFKKTKNYWISVVGSFLCLVSAFYLLFSKYEIVLPWVKQFDIALSNDLTSTINVILCCFFTFIIVIFSKELVSYGKENTYFSFIFLILSFSNLLIFSKNLLIILISWEILGLIIYLMIRFVTQEDNYKVATKSLVTIAITDFCLFVGIILLIVKTGRYILTESFNLDVTNNSLIFTLLIIAALGKLGSVPFHNWIPEASCSLPANVSAYVVGAIDKIIGIYWFVRVTKDIFVLKTHLFLMFLGALTILIAVFMALHQHNLKKLLSYHAISQVGYMIVGISTGTTIGMIAGVFHMINNIIYKTLLFLSADMVEKNAEDVELSKPKNLSKVLPYTFLFTLIAAVSIAGIPPFNGFVSKWMIYQSLILSIGSTKSVVVMFVLISAIFGSALTLASFVKVLHSLFLSGTQKNEISPRKIEKFNCILSMGMLSILCVIFGVFAYEVPISLVSKMVNIYSFKLSGEWNAKVAFYLLITGLIIGSLIYMLFVDKPRKVKVYMLGEENKLNNTTIPATDFYLTIVETYPFYILYNFAQQRLLDFYNWFYGILSLLASLVKTVIQLEFLDVYLLGKKLIFKTGDFLSKLHNGNLHSYISWVFLGILILIILFIF